MILLLFSACGGATTPHVADNPASQRFRDATRLFPIEKLSVSHASFLSANQDNLSDLAVLNKTKSELYILINRGKKGFLKKQAGQWTQNNKEEINFFCHRRFEQGWGRRFSFNSWRQEKSENTNTFQQ
jgi:hypothetical protein